MIPVRVRLKFSVALVAEEATHCARRAGRGLEHFQAKWIPVRVKKMRQNKKQEPFHVSTKREKTLAFRAASILAAFALLTPNALESAAANGDTRTLYLYHSHSKETIAATFRVDGHYDAAALEKLNWFLRDWRNDEPTHMDPRLFDAVWESYRSTGRNTGEDDPIVIVSAYRCPATNAMLRRRSRSVAEHSQHMLGKAMDSTMPGLSMEKLREIAMRMQRGGVGYYPNANTPFVHIDVGGVRHWPRMNYDQLARLFPDGKTVHIPSNGKPLSGYDEAKAEIEARGGETISIAEANRDGGGIGGFFASLFGGGHKSEDEEEIREAAPLPKPSRVASARSGDLTDSALAKAQRKMVASAETNLPRGETYLAPSDGGGQRAVAPPPVSASIAVAALPQKPVPQKPMPLDEAPPAAPSGQASDESAPAGRPAPDDAPLPPRRPQEFAVLEAPQPPPRPAEYARLPYVITLGARLGGSPVLRGAAGVEPLAYATPRADLARIEFASPAAESAPAAPLPPPRPVFAPMRAAAIGKAEQARAAKSAVAHMERARVDRAALAAMVAPARNAGTRPTVAASFAPPLRAAAKLDVFAANAPPPGQPARFGSAATLLNPNAFTK